MTLIFWHFCLYKSGAKVWLSSILLKCRSVHTCTCFFLNVFKCVLENDHKVTSFFLMIFLFCRFICWACIAYQINSGFMRAISSGGTSCPSSIYAGGKATIYQKNHCFSSCASVSVLGDQCFMQQAKQLTHPGGVPNPRTRMTMWLGWGCRVTATRYGSDMLMELNSR